MERKILWKKMKSWDLMEWGGGYNRVTEELRVLFLDNQENSDAGDRKSKILVKGWKRDLLESKMIQDFRGSGSLPGSPIP